MNAWTTRFDLPIEAYYRTGDDQDVRHMMKDGGKPTVAQEHYLWGVWTDIHEWLSRELNAAKVSMFMRAERKEVNLIGKMMAMRRIMELLVEVPPEIFAAAKAWDDLRNALAGWSVVLYNDTAKTIDECRRIMLGAKTDIERLRRKREEGQDERTDWMESVVGAGRAMGMRVDPKVTSVAEWAAIVKQIQAKRHG